MFNICIQFILISSLPRLARYLEVLNMPDDFRELLDEYIDASERSDGAKACEELNPELHRLYNKPLNPVYV